YEMPEDVIEETIQKYADAALFAKNCGFGMVNIHGAHGWLITQFLSPLTNHRKDKWGGSLENRARFPIAVMDAIRRACGPNFPIEMRFSASECCEGGYDVDEAIAYAKMFDGHLDLLHVSSGQYSGAYAIVDMFVHTFPSMFSPDGANVPYAAAIKPHVQMPVATVGALADAEFLEEIIASGKCDVVEMARQIICDPDTPRKYREGREDEVRKCMRCYACFSNAQLTNGYHCAINPAAGLETVLAVNQLPAEKKTVLVAGGGMAGMTAALTAWKRGHRVILCEKSDRLGGVLLCEHEVPFKKRLAAYIDQTVRQIEKSDIEVRLNCEVTPALVEEIRADEVIAALGGEQAVPPIEGLAEGREAGIAVNSEDAFANPDALGEKVVILGCGLVGAELGIYLNGLGKQVEFVELANLPDFMTVFARRMGFKESYLSLAEECGFDHASPLDVSTLQVETWVRDTCAEDKCHAYDHNWTCPPACGTLDECEAEMQKYEQGILLQVTGTQEKQIDVQCYAETEQRLRDALLVFADRVREDHPDCLVLGAGGCRICPQCAYPDPCRFPEKAMSSMEAYGLFVTRVCKDNGVPYYYGPQTITYTACVLY
ncbi:MAG: FAD-dependent oxidoreductase, partial [Lachnospiraceae bacterium]|nr:FAD-dependent oxidoreductase [Lachnospiraceae bacterium]